MCLIHVIARFNVLQDHTSFCFEHIFAYTLFIYLVAQSDVRLTGDQEDAFDPHWVQKHSFYSHSLPSADSRSQ